MQFPSILASRRLAPLSLAGALVLAFASLLQPARAQDASERTLLEIPLDRSLSRYVPQPAAPRFPVEGALRWSQWARWPRCGSPA